MNLLRGERPATALGRMCGLLMGAMALVVIVAGMLTVLILTLRLFWRLVFP